MNESYNFNFYLPLIISIFVIAFFSIDTNFSLFIEMLLLLILFGSLCLVWKCEFNKQELKIKYLISFGRNRWLTWKEISDVIVFYQKYHGRKMKELKIITKKGRSIKFFRLGILQYNDLIDNIKEQFDKASKNT
jgi:hypothetical protein